MRLTERRYSLPWKEIFRAKGSSTEESGDLTRQIYFLTNNYTYRDGEDPGNECILIPRYRAVGRVAPSGRRYGPVTKRNEDDLVEVRSIISKLDRPNTVTPDLLSTQNSDFTDGAALGSSFGTSFTEAITQGALSLKHGGHEKVLDETAYFYAPMDCEFTEDGKWMVLKSLTGSKCLKYPKPTNFILAGPTEFKKGDLIGTAYHTISPINKLNSLIAMFHASSGNTGRRYFEKDNIIRSECYAYTDGVISYGENKKGNITVSIDGHEYDYNPEVLYFYPDGSKIKKYQRICSGLLNADIMTVACQDNLRLAYLLFRKQFYELQDPDFSYRDETGVLVTGTVDDHTTQEELVETLFISLIRVKRDSKNKVSDINYLGTLQGTLNNTSFYTVLSYGYAGRVVSKALRGEVRLTDDTMTETVLGLLLRNELDSDN